MKLHKELIKFDLQMFAGNLNTNVTGDSGMSVEMKTYYSNYLIKLAGPELVHDQFGQKHPIPRNGGKTIEFRKYSPLGKALTPLTEGVTPDGKKLEVTNLTASVAQYGDYVTISDVLQLTAIDDNVVQATELLGQQAGRTLDTITREVLAGGTSVQYADGSVSSRASLLQTNANHKLTVKAIKMAVRNLKVQNAPKINGYYVAIIHPDCAFDLMNDPEWRAPKEYCDPKDLYEGEIGMIAGCRFVETTEAKVFAGQGGGTPKADIYSTLVLGANAYGVTEVEGGGLEHITKQLGSGGTQDPLNQRATCGWKAIKTAERLVESYMVRIETVSSFNVGAN